MLLPLQMARHSGRKDTINNHNPIFLMGFEITMTSDLRSIGIVVHDAQTGRTGRWTNTSLAEKRVFWSVSLGGSALLHTSDGPDDR